ncbi:hypothetical protein C8A00DRAFT_38820 [Chaetomidium leptoderma]|uniref:Rhodopsin domain-containing protein n=1 Tax=Chaetomidium leptoderma TaxID=669021 RepID=A0AAN6VC01_9PEZI|nr:hypothetical protein C8A00DRAFT_38820 [Chaetomidium leptoderma]
MEEGVSNFLRELWALQGTVYLVVALRYISRIRTAGWDNLAWDDAVMALATIVQTFAFLAAHFLVVYTKGLANNGMTDEQRAALDPGSEEYRTRVLGSKIHVGGLLLYTAQLWLLKACWTIYYDRLTAGVHMMRRVIRAAYILIPLTFIMCLLVAFLKCIPFEKQWQIYPDPGNKCQPAISTLQTVVIMVLHVVTVLFLMAIPLPMVWKANLPLRKKLMLFIMFSGGFLEMTFSILRCTSILMLGNIDPGQSGYWSVRESFVSMVLTNMPMVYPLVKHFFEKGLSSLGGSKSGTNLADSHGYPLGSNTGRDRKVRTNTHNSNHHPLSIPGDTVYWGSEENIVENNADAKTTATNSSGDEGPSPLPLQGQGGRLKPDGARSDKRPTATGTQPPTSPRHPRHGSGTERTQVSVGQGPPSPVGQSMNGIVVTTEYTVTEGSEQNRRRSGAGFAF